MSQEIVIPPFETDTVEFKTQWTESAKKAISAFLNSSGGTIYFGVDDAGNVLGIPQSQVDKLLNTISIVTRQGFRPAADALVRTRVHEIKGRYVVVATVLAGTDLPYYATIKGEGSRAYIRRGPACFEVTDDERRQLILRSDRRDWDSLPASQQNLSFLETKRLFDEQNIEFSERKFPIWGMTDDNGFYTNLAYLLSDQCSAQTRVGFFDGTDKASDVTSITTFCGSVFHQLNQVLTLLQGESEQRIEAFSIGADGTRQAMHRFPPKAVREAVVNAFAHRDYSTGLQAFISVFSDRMEIFTFGGLPKGVLASQLEEGASACRNSKLADLLMRFGLMERYGLGIPSIFAAYKAYALRPEIQVDPNRILMTLPKLPAQNLGLTGDPSVLYSILLQRGDSSRADLQRQTGWSLSKTTLVLNQLLAQKLIVRVGAGRSTQYRVINA